MLVIVFTIDFHSDMERDPKKTQYFNLCPFLTLSVLNFNFVTMSTAVVSRKLWNDCSPVFFWEMSVWILWLLLTFTDIFSICLKMFMAYLYKYIRDKLENNKIIKKNNKTKEEDDQHSTVFWLPLALYIITWFREDICLEFLCIFKLQKYLWNLSLSNFKIWLSIRSIRNRNHKITQIWKPTTSHTFFT